MTIPENWGGAARTAPAPEVATSPDTAIYPYSGQLAFASRH